MADSNFPIKMILTAWAFGIVGFLCGYNFDPNLFSRFGSVIVLLAIVAEYSLFKSELDGLYRRLEGQGAAVCGNAGIQNLKPTSWHKRQSLFAHITIVVGTFIWGFGDLIIST